MKLGKKLLAVVLAAMLALVMLTACNSTPAALVTADKVVDAVNAVRTKNGLQALTVSAAATNVADEWAALYDQKLNGTIADEEYQTQWRKLNAMSVEGTWIKGYVTVKTSRSSTAMTEDYWQQLYNGGDTNRSDNRIVSSPEAVYIGVSIKTMKDGRFFATIVTY